MSEVPAEGAVFLDRDGVLNEVVYRAGRPASPRSLDEFVLAEDAADEVRKLRTAGRHVFVVTNQPDIARGLLDPDVLGAMSKGLRTHLDVDEVRVCPHDDPDDCACRKPKPGMLLDLARRWNVALDRSFLVGDSWKDMEAGRAAGCRTVLIRRPYNADARADHRVDTLADAVELILNEKAE